MLANLTSPCPHGQRCGGRALWPLALLALCAVCVQARAQDHAVVIEETVVTATKKHLGNASRHIVAGAHIKGVGNPPATAISPNGFADSAPLANDGPKMQTAGAPPPPPPAQGEGGFDIRDHLGLTAVALVSKGGSLTRRATKVEASWNQSFGRSSLTAAVEFVEKSAMVEAELTPGAQRRCERRDEPQEDEDDLEYCDEPTITLDLDVPGRARLSELYFNWVPRDGLEVGVGLSPLSWGQFLLLSPVNFMLPQNLGADLGLSRGTLQYAQPHLSLRWSPSERLELGVYHFTGIQIDPTLAVVDTALFNADSEGMKVDEREVYDWLTDKTQTGFRVLYRPDWGALGFTMLDGVASLFEAYRPESLVRFSGQEMVDGQTVNFYEYGDCPGPRARSPFAGGGYPGCPDDIEGDVGFLGELPDSTYLGLELLVQLGGGWNLLGEWVHIKTLETPFPVLELDGPIIADAVYVEEGEPDFHAQAQPEAGGTGRRLSTRSLFTSEGTANPHFLSNPSDAFDRAACNFNEALIGGLGRLCKSLQEPGYIASTLATGRMRTRPAAGDGEFASTLQVLSIGVEKISTEEVGWSYSLQLLYLSESFDDPKYDHLSQLYGAADDEFEDFNFVVPGFYALYNHRFHDRPGQLVLGTGFFASFAGVIALWNLDITDHFSAQLGLELVTRASDEQRAEAEDGYTAGESLAPAISLGFSLAL